jgi:hypothetical protein
VAVQKTIAQGINLLGNAIGQGLALLLHKPVRDLSDQEAFSLFQHQVAQGDIVLLDPPKGGLIFKPGQRQRFKVKTSLAGVDFLRAASKNPGRNGSVGATKTPYFEPTAAFALVLFRFAHRLRTNWGATHIVWGGIGHGSGKNTLDCHMIGTCVDFYGASTAKGNIDVREHWFYRPVYLKDGKLHARDKDTLDRWVNDTSTYYRLAESKEAVDALARDFFADVYAFVSEECAFSRYDVPPNLFLQGAALKSGVTIHPDYPHVGLRRSHNDHIHFQLGQAILRR